MEPTTLPIDAISSRENAATEDTALLRSASFGSTGTGAITEYVATFLDVTHLAVEAGFLVPVAVSPALWRDLCALPDDSPQDVYGRLRDLFFMARWMIAREPILAIRELTFTLPLPVKGNEEYEDYGVHLVTGDANRGEAGILLFRQGER